MTGSLRKIYNEEISNSKLSADIIMMMKLRRMSWWEHVESMGEKTNT
jgi:hypothetical protein